MLLNRFRSRILALARKVVVVVVFSSFTCALLIRCMKYNYVSQWPLLLCVAMARCFKKTYWAPTVGDMRLYMDENTKVLTPEKYLLSRYSIDRTGKSPTNDCSSPCSSMAYFMVVSLVFFLDIFLEKGYLLELKWNRLSIFFYPVKLELLIQKPHSSPNFP